MLATMIMRCCCSRLHRPWPTWSLWSCWSGPSLILLFQPSIVFIFNHCLLTVFLIVECPHHRSITSSCRQPLLAFTTLSPLADGWLLRPCSLRALLSPARFHHCKCRCFVDGRCPLLLPITIHCPLALIASRCLS